ncbi:hypothetical protein BKI52_39980 [marine bacterium AO1-C]|nr:hypothetical protein BKI52_39980 [marine bacterium AO1-C]
MDNQTTISWHPKFKQYPLSDGGLVLLGEKQCFFLTGEKFQNIINGVANQTSVGSLISQARNHTQALRLQRFIENLLKQQLLIDSNTDLTYFLPNTSPNLADFKVHEHLYNFSSATLPVSVVEHLTQSAITFVVADDYLQPQIKTLLQQISSPFLLIKLTGERLFVGPYLTRKPSTPCWQCLANQMLANQPVRRWVQARENTNYVPLPIFLDDTLPPFEKLRPLIQQALDEPYALFEINRCDFSSQKHVVHHHPQCAACGDSNWMKTQIQHPIVLQHSGNKIANDGGSRTFSAQDTVQSLQSFISPITGMITNLMELPTSRANAIKIYRTAFFKTPSSFKSIDQQDFVQVSLGKGVDPMQSRASALCESIERFAAQYQGDEYWQLACPQDLEARYYTPNQLVQFSAKQYKSFLEDRQSITRTKFATKRYDLASPLHWLPTWSVTSQEKVYIPFNYGFANTPFETDNQYIRWNSNGCAAGNTLEEAILQGLFELIERDATAIWWYNRIEAQAMDLCNLPAEQAQKFEQALQDWRYWVLNITTDLGIPVMAGIAQHKDTGKFCLGFGCHLNAVVACQRALAELCQLVPIRDQNGAPFDFDAIRPEAFLMPQGEAKAFNSFIQLETSTLKDDILFCVQKLKENGLETLVLNYSRPDLPIKTAKVIVPGLCHIWPQLEAQRLYNIPIKMGWTTVPKSEDALNPHSLYI